MSEPLFTPTTARDLHRNLIEWWGSVYAQQWAAATADAFTADPTVRRCLGFARAWGAGGLTVLNVFALRSTDPRALDRHPDPVGPANDAVIRRHLAGAMAGRIVAAWGADKAVRATGRDAALCALVRATTGQVLACLGVTKGGAPRHPLYVRGDVQPGPWSG